MILPLSVYLTLVASSSEQPQSNQESNPNLIPIPDSEREEKPQPVPKSNAELKEAPEKDDSNPEAPEEKGDSNVVVAPKKDDELKNNEEKKAAPDSEGCPAPEEDEDKKYQCKYSLKDGAAFVYVGRDKKNLHVKAMTKDARWLGVGVSLAGMKNLSVVLNQNDATEKNGSGAKYVDKKENPTNAPEPDGDNAFVEVKHSFDNHRVTEFTFDRKNWEEKNKSGISIAFGAAADEEAVSYHMQGHFRYLKFDGSFKMYALPADVGDDVEDEEKEDDLDIDLDDDEGLKAGNDSKRASPLCALAVVALFLSA